MNRIGKATIALGLVSLGLALAPWACMDKDLMQAKSALCSRNESVPCGATPDGGASTGGLLGYTCPREARPDMDPHYNQGVPQGLVCGDFGAANGDDTQNYCCSAQVTTCAYNPVSICPQNTYSMLLTGVQEVPANDSPGTATVMVSFNDTAGSVAVSGSFSNLTSGATSAHIHGPAAFGQTGDVIVTLSVPPITVSRRAPVGHRPRDRRADEHHQERRRVPEHPHDEPPGRRDPADPTVVLRFPVPRRDRPEALNPLIDCGNGVREDELINYCCTARPIAAAPGNGLRAVRRSVHGEVASGCPTA